MYAKNQDSKFKSTQSYSHAGAIATVKVYTGTNAWAACWARLMNGPGKMPIMKHRSAGIRIGISIVKGMLDAFSESEVGLFRTTRYIILR